MTSRSDDERPAAPGATARTLAALVAGAAPLPPRRAAAAMVPVAAEVQHLVERGRVPVELTSRSVVLHADGDVELRCPSVPAQVDPTGAEPPTANAAGAAIGRLLFELLVGRAPFERAEAFEPVLTAGLGAETCALLARSIDDTPAQWPAVQEWSPRLVALAGGAAPASGPTPTRRRRRRRAAVAVAVALVVLASAAVVVAAPRWWADATDEGRQREAAPIADIADAADGADGAAQAPLAWS